MPEEQDFIEFDDDGNPVYDCWQCGGTGRIAGCFEDTCCGLDCDPDEPEYCCAPSRCDICHGEGFYAVPEKTSVCSEESDG